MTEIVRQTIVAGGGVDAVPPELGHEHAPFGPSSDDHLEPPARRPGGSSCGEAQALDEPGAPFEPMTTETATGSADEVDIEQGVDGFAFLVVLGLGVHRPHVVARSRPRD